VAGTYGASRHFGLWRLGSTLGGRVAAGRTGDDPWSRFGGTAGLSIAHQDVRLAVAWRRDGSHGVTRAFDLYQLGGSPTSLLPGAALAERIVSPALPAAALIGAEHEEERVELDLGFLPMPLFWERHRLWGGGFLAQPAEVTLGGLEYRLALAPYPLVRLPAIDLRLGAARVFSDPLRERYRFWLLSVWRP
jgi:hypothetical protein